ncbi:MAG: B12-binding domain-containing radical SAM protein, partial [Ktedonobacteraceae bacterium]
HHNIYFGDETFTLHSGHTLELLTALKQEGNITYDCQTRLNCLSDAHVLQALPESGCRWIEIGIETVNQESSNIFKQRTKLHEMEDILARVRDAGLATCSFMVNGFPNQTLDDMKRSIEYICSLIDQGLLQASYLFGLVPYPGSDMYAHPEKYGMQLLHRDFKYYHEEMAPVFRSAYAQPDKIYDVFLQGVADLAEVMNSSSSFTPQVAAGDLAQYGTFWQDPHV